MEKETEREKERGERDSEGPPFLYFISTEFCVAGCALKFIYIQKEETDYGVAFSSKGLWEKIKVV